MAFIMAVALGVRLAWSLSRPADVESLRTLPDQIEYLDVADSLLAGRGFSFVDARFDDELKAFRLPGYPLLIAATGGRIEFIRVFQSILDVSTILAVGLLARKLVSPTAGIVAAAFVCLDPFAVFFSALILSESLFAAMLAWAMFAIVGASRFANGRWWAGVVLLSLAALVKPTAIPILFFTVLASIPRPSELDGPRRFPVWVVARVGVVLILVMLPWLIRNRVAVGGWTLSTNAGFTLYDGLHADATGGSDQRFFERFPELLSMNEIERSRFLSGQAVEFARDNPKALAVLAIKKLGRTWSPVPLSDAFGSRPLYAWAGGAFSIALFLAAFVGLFRVPPKHRRVLLAPIVALTLVHMITVGSLRYRVPIHPILAVFAGAAASVFSRRSPIEYDSNDVERSTSAA